MLAPLRLLVDSIVVRSNYVSKTLLVEALWVTWPLLCCLCTSVASMVTVLQLFVCMPAGGSREQFLQTVHKTLAVCQFRVCTLWSVSPTFLNAPLKDPAFERRTHIHLSSHQMERSSLCRISRLLHRHSPDATALPLANPTHSVVIIECL